MVVYGKINCSLQSLYFIVLTICVVNTMKYRHGFYFRQSITITIRFGQSIKITFGQSISITGQFQSVTITITRPSPLLIGHLFALDRLRV